MSDVVAEHTVFEIECIDRTYLNVYVPQLRYAAGIVPAVALTDRTVAVKVARRSALAVRDHV